MITRRNIGEIVGRRVKQNIPEVGGVQISERVLHVNLSQVQGRGGGCVRVSTKNSKT